MTARKKAPRAAGRAKSARPVVTPPPAAPTGGPVWVEKYGRPCYWDGARLVETYAQRPMSTFPDAGEAEYFIRKTIEQWPELVRQYAGNALRVREPS